MITRGWIERDRSTRGNGRWRYNYFRAIFNWNTFRIRRRFRTREAAEAFLADESAKAAWVATHHPRKSAEEHRRCRSARWARYRERLHIRWAASAALYAKHRAQNRVDSLVFKIRHGKRSAYRPRFNRRIPDWVTFGKVVWADSPWLVENLTPAQRAYAMELAIERRNQRWGM